MKKLTLATMILATMSSSVFAADTIEVGDTDTTTATLTWQARVPVIATGKWMTITGENGTGALEAALKIANDGTFNSDPIKVEVRSYDADTGDVGELLVVDGSGATSGTPYLDGLTYSISTTSFVADKGTDVSALQGQLREETMGIVGYAGVKSQLAKTSWTIENGLGEVLPPLLAGETLKAQAVLRVDATYM